MKIGIACDHHGVELKNLLIDYLYSKGYDVVNFGTDTNDMVDYPDYAFKVAEAVRDNVINYGILLCNTGIGMSIAANKVKNVRCARVCDEYDAKMTRRDNNANMIALSARIELSKLKNILDMFLETEYLKIDRYDRRIEKIDNYAF